MNKRDIIEHCLTFPASYEDYPFDENWAAMRHKGNTKTFAFVYERNGKLCVNFKCEPNEADILRRIYKDVTPAYHMNKEHWNTAVLGGDLPEDEFKRMINRSYDLTKPKMRKRNESD